MERARFRIGQSDLVIHDGDIARVPAQALITAINNEGKWHGGIDHVIQHAAGWMFHAQARNAMPLGEGQIVFARKTGDHDGAWGDVLFVVDDLQHPLSWIIERALRAAAQAGYTSVSLPAIRTGAAVGLVEPDERAAVDQIGIGLRDVLAAGSTLREIHFVIYDSPQVLQLMISGTIAKA